MADWSTLPSELVRHIADCLLSTNDLDCYMHFRAVCPSWRSATDDPTNSSDLRFRPLRWIIIDELFESDDRLLVNTATGRVMRKDLPLLRRFYVVATTHGGFFVLADKEPPHAARILNPFTGHMIPFVASVPSHIDISAAAIFGDPFPNLLLLSDTYYELYTAAVQSEAFIGDDNKYVYIFKRLYVASGVCANSREKYLQPTPRALPTKMSAVMKLFDIEPVSVLSDYVGLGQGSANRCFLVKSAAQLLFVVMLQHHQFKVFNITTYGDEPEPLKNIGNHAIFVGNRRCVSVTTEKLPSVVANCIYYVKRTNSSMKIYKYDLEDEVEEMVSEAVDSFNPVTSSSANCPFTLVQHLSSYTFNVRVSQLPMEEPQFPDWYYSIDPEIVAECVSNLDLNSLIDEISD